MDNMKQYIRTSVFIIVLLSTALLTGCFEGHEMKSCYTDCNFLIKNSGDTPVTVEFLYSAKDEIYNPPRANFSDTVSVTIPPQKDTVIDLNLTWEGMDQCDVFTVWDIEIDNCGYVKNSVQLDLYMNIVQDDREFFTPYLISLDEFETKTGKGAPSAQSPHHIPLWCEEAECGVSFVDTLNINQIISSQKNLITVKQ